MFEASATFLKYKRSISPTATSLPYKLYELTFSQVWFDCETSPPPRANSKLLFRYINKLLLQYLLLFVTETWLRKIVRNENVTVNKIPESSLTSRIKNVASSMIHRNLSDTRLNSYGKKNKMNECSIFTIET